MGTTQQPRRSRPRRPPVPGWRVATTEVAAILMGTGTGIYETLGQGRWHVYIYSVVMFLLALGYGKVVAKIVERWHAGS